MVNQAAVVDALYVARKNGEQPSGLAQVQFGLEEALEIQLHVLGRFESEGENLGGWKVGLT
jgi:2-keto-4-pentenoate hydratase